MIKKITTALYTLDKKLPKNPIGRRMIIIRYGKGKLALHSAIAAEGELQNKLNKLGTVSLIIIPNAWHSLDAQKVATKYPNAHVLCPKDIQESLSKDITVHGSLEESLPEDFQEEIDYSMVQGLKKPEALFYHKADKTLLVADLFFNFKKSDFSGITKWIMALNKAIGFGTTRIYHLAMVKNNVVLQNYLKEQFKLWKIERTIPCHGHIIDEKPKLF